MMGYLPNDVLSLCHWPELLQSLSGLVKTILQSGQVDPALKRLIGIISSHTQGCTYCTAHAGYGANQLGVDAEKIAAVFEFETSPLFSAAERAALRVAWHGALQPSAVTDDDIAALTQHFSQPEIVEIVAVLSLYGFLNRWNSTLDTELEAPPADFAQSLSALSKDAQR
jgi:AhpD family alkylhydroperoxidase